jgi:ribosomal protein L40E
MADTVVCSQCGARNPAEIEWCGQCFASLRSDEDSGESSPATHDPVVPAEEQTVGVVDEASVEAEDATPVETKAGTWVCTVCDTSNSLADPHCSACGTSIYTAFGAADEEKIEVDPQRALLRSVMFPGLGHALAGQGLLGSAIGGVTLMALGFGIALAATAAGRYGWPLILLAVAVWVAAALDAFRIAGGETDAVLLRPRVVTALVGLVMVVVILAAFLQGRA